MKFSASSSANKDFFALKKAFPKTTLVKSYKTKAKKSTDLWNPKNLLFKARLWNHLDFNTFLCKCVVSNFVLHVYLCHCSSLAPYIKSTGSQQQQQSVYSLILHSRVCLTVLIYLPAWMWTLWKVQVSFGDGNCTPEI